MALTLFAVQTGGSKLWRLRYRFAGKENTLWLGSFPGSVARLGEGKARCGPARYCDGKDPAEQKKLDKLAAVEGSRLADRFFLLTFGNLPPLVDLLARLAWRADAPAGVTGRDHAAEFVQLALQEFVVNKGSSKRRAHVAITQSDRGVDGEVDVVDFLRGLGHRLSLNSEILHRLFGHFEDDRYPARPSAWTAQSLLREPCDRKIPAARRDQCRHIELSTVRAFPAWSLSRRACPRRIAW